MNKLCALLLLVYSICTNDLEINVDREKNRVNGKFTLSRSTNNNSIGNVIK
jgi:hypothetical protein